MSPADTPVSESERTLVHYINVSHRTPPHFSAPSIHGVRGTTGAVMDGATAELQAIGEIPTITVNPDRAKIPRCGERVVPRLFAAIKRRNAV